MREILSWFSKCTGLRISKRNKTRDKYPQSGNLLNFLIFISLSNSLELLTFLMRSQRLEIDPSILTTPVRMRTPQSYQKVKLT